MRVKVWMGASLAGLAAVGVATAARVQATPSTAASTVLVRATIDPLDVSARNTTLDGRRWHAELETRGLTDGYVVDNKFAPGQDTGWHSHPGPSLIFVVS